MRPLSLSLEGFTSFKEPAEIDFKGLRLFVLKGPNGAGKSSLLEALLVALFGDAPRNRGGKLKELISQDRSEFRIALEFQVDDQVYRVQRRYPRKGLPQVRLEVQKDGHPWQTLADKVKETDRAIVRILKIGYDTFTKSVILPQNLFDRFLKGDKEKRREVLDEILSLKLYEKVASLAGEKSRILEERIRQDEILINELVAKTEEADFEALRRQVSQFRSELSGLLAKREALTQRAMELNRLAEKERHLFSLRAQAKQVEEETGACFRACAEAERALALITREGEEKGPPLKERQASLLSLRGMGARYEKLALEERAKAQGLSRVNQKLETLRAQLSCIEKNRKKAIPDLEDTRLKKKELEIWDFRFLLLSDFLDKIKDLEILETEQNKIRAKHKQTGEELFNLTKKLEKAKADRESLERDMAECGLENEKVRKSNAVALLRRGLSKGEPCPVCAQDIRELPPRLEPPPEPRDRVPLERNHQKILVEIGKLSGAASRMSSECETFQIQSREIAARIESFRSLLSRELGYAVPDIVVKAREEYKRLRDNHEHLKAFRQREENLTKRMERLEGELKESKIHSDPLDKEKSTLEALLARLSQEMKVLEESMSQAGVTPLSIGNLENMISDLERQFTELSRKKETTEKRFHQLQERLKVFTQQSEKSKDRLSVESREVSELRNKLLPGTEKTQPQQELACLEERIQLIQHEIGRLNQQLAALEESKTKIIALEEKRNHSKEAEILYATLHQDLQKNRLPDFLFSTVLTQILDRAGEKFLLFSGGRYQLALEGTAEIQVLDGWSANLSRPVESLSGGESFAASLSFALALSDYLQGRQKIQCLLIDEGFGNLDHDTRDKVAEILSTLETEDKLIGIVTHIEELAELFPEQIRVEKLPEGSRIRRKEKSEPAPDPGRISVSVA